MSQAELSARLVKALETEAIREVAGAALVSTTFEVVAAARAEAIEAKLVRRTRPLMFLSAEATAGDGKTVATASAVFKVKATSA